MKNKEERLDEFQEEICQLAKEWCEKHDAEKIQEILLCVVGDIAAAMYVRYKIPKAQQAKMTAQLQAWLKGFIQKRTETRETMEKTE